MHFKCDKYAHADGLGHGVVACNCSEDSRLSLQFPSLQTECNALSTPGLCLPGSISDDETESDEGEVRISRVHRRT